MGDSSYFLPNNCPILERTGDNRPVGRCCFYLEDGVCPRHGDVSKYRDKYQETGKLTDEKDMKPPGTETECSNTIRDVVDVQPMKQKSDLDITIVDIDTPSRKLKGMWPDDFMGPYPDFPVTGDEND